MRKYSGSNEEGLTLVEVLAALVILGILFVAT
ncbi:prepilin-type N-terminal cleavage/methylation domain-containing protein [Planococcus sp. MERTA32b]|nr:prepilin-type N-terminal cleavage/methylation domain-containing protein [Planococcus sp. MER TA 32b]